MDRRQFVTVAGAGLASEVLAGRLVGAQRRSGPAPSPRPALMKVGTQHGDSDAILRAMAGFGVNHICSGLPSVRLDEQWSVEALSRLRERVESFGVTLAMVPLPMSSTEISRYQLPGIRLGDSPA